MIGPHGTSAASRPRATRPRSLAASRSAIAAASSTRCSTRSPFVANRGSSASSGGPSASQKRGHCRSDPTATAISPSAVANVSYGTMFGWALPRRPGAPGDEGVLRLVDEDRKRRRQERDVDALAAPPARRDAASQEPCQDADGGEQAGHDVADRDADLRRVAAFRVRRPR